MGVAFTEGDRVTFTAAADQDLAGCAGKVRVANPPRGIADGFAWVHLTHGPFAGYDTTVPYAHMRHID